MAWLKRIIPWAFCLAWILSWEASPSDGVTGYKVYSGPDKASVVFLEDVGNVLQVTITVDKDHKCFGVTAYDATMESVLSEIVCAKPKKIKNFQREIN